MKPGAVGGAHILLGKSGELEGARGGWDLELVEGGPK